MLLIKDLIKTYSSGVQALKGISLEIQPGMFGLLGPNGAGKTTLMKILATLLEPDSGAAEMDGVDLINAKAETRKKLVTCRRTSDFIRHSRQHKCSTILQSSKVSLTKRKGVR